MRTADAVRAGRGLRDSGRWSVSVGLDLRHPRLTEDEDEGDRAEDEQPGDEEGVVERKNRALQSCRSIENDDRTQFRLCRVQAPRHEARHQRVHTRLDVRVRRSEMLDEHADNLKKYYAIAIEIGTSDGLLASNKQLHETMTRLRIPHDYEEYDGDHTNKVRERIERNVLPFFARNLVAPANPTNPQIQP